MSIARHHAEWLLLIETSGPFLSMPVMMRVFPQGLDQRDKQKVSELRNAYEEWFEEGKNQLSQHRGWILHVLTNLLEYPSSLLLEGQAIPPGLEANMPQFSEVIRPDLVLKNNSGSGASLLIKTYPADQSLDGPISGRIWKASPATRMMELLHATNIPVGLLTNGEQWMLVYAPRGETTGFASWYADLWMQEPITLRAFHSLLHLRRFFGVAAEDTLPALLQESSKDQQEVTDQLGYQVRQAVEVLVAAFDQVDAESGRALLADVNEQTVYDAALTIMMRLVFLFAAEERGLLLLGDPLYDQHYAVSTLRDILRERADQSGEEVLERRHDAWSRLLSVFRAIHAGVQHDAMRLPAYGGTLFDPDRYPFLEGRKIDTCWKDTVAKPLPVNNRVVLHLLEALQILQVKVPGGGPSEARKLSFRSLDIEQIGHVYEGLLDHTAKRADEVILGLGGTRNKEPEISLSQLEQLKARGIDNLVDFLKDQTGRSNNALKKAIESPNLTDEHKLVVACGQDNTLLNRIRPFAGLIREDSFDNLVIIPQGSVYVTSGTTRRSTGTHYTPRSLTEPIVQYTLEPLVYSGPVEGKSQAEWKLKSPKEILDLKVCDMAMGSGAFLVQTCRYLAERLVEAWEQAEKANPGMIIATPEGEFSVGDPQERLIPTDPIERLAIARRFIADRCLHGVDINPMAVEMAKLSIWLITLQKDRPFTFLDHAFKCGDSLLGICRLKQLEVFDLDDSNPKAKQVLILSNYAELIQKAIEIRKELEGLPSNNSTQIATKQALHIEAEERLARLKLASDLLIAASLSDGNAQEKEMARVNAHINVSEFHKRSLDEFSSYTKQQLNGSRTLHWPLEFPEVFEKGGFDAFIGNPPFLGGKRISGNFGSIYREYLVEYIAGGNKGNADLCAFFFLRGCSLLNSNACFGLIATSSMAEGETREVGLDNLENYKCKIYKAENSKKWPGSASVTYASIWITTFGWVNDCILDGDKVASISSYLKEVGEVSGKPYKLKENAKKAFIGSFIYGQGFVLTEEEALNLLKINPENTKILFPYLIGQDFNSKPDQSPGSWVINFSDLSLAEAEKYVECMEIVREKVKPERDKLNDKGYREKWWQYGRRAVALYKSIPNLERVLFHSFTSKYTAFGFVSAKIIYAAPHVVFAYDDYMYFAILQSMIHETWVREYTSYSLSLARYTPSDCFETFPMPLIKRPHNNLETIGKDYYIYRQKIMKENNEGLTDVYNRFHNPEVSSQGIVELRNLHKKMNEIVAVAYEWNDINMGYDYHETKDGLRLTISEAAKKEILKRLLKLNHERHSCEIKSGLYSKKTTLNKRKKNNYDDTQKQLF